MTLYTPVALKLHAFGLQRLHDPNWTGMEMFDQLKGPVRRDGFHDRELCAYLSQLIVSIGFDGMDSPRDTEPKKWMGRVNIPIWAKDMDLVAASDRGFCAQCKAAITMELEADDHFDHMVPLARGGCNDIVNLQLLCQACNLKKSKNEVPIYSSIPPYLLRFHREQ